MFRLKHTHNWGPTVSVFVETEVPKGETCCFGPRGNYKWMRYCNTCRVLEVFYMDKKDGWQQECVGKLSRKQLKKMKLKH
jgi:hypothetical protein